MEKANGMKSLALSVCMKTKDGEKHECLDEDFFFFFRKDDENFANKSVLLWRW